jgi:hypothetical protein
MTEKTEQNDAGRGLVRRVFVDPVTQAGLGRPRGMTAGAFDAGLDRLITALDHMGAENLATLAEAVVAHAAQSTGQARGLWPAFVLVQSWAHGLQPRPFRLSRIVTSWLASVEGPVAQAGGYEVQLLRFLRRAQRPPLPADVAECKAQAIEDRRRLERVQERLANGVAWDEDRAWHAAFLGDQAQAAAFIDQGRAVRAQSTGVAA